MNCATPVTPGRHEGYFVVETPFPESVADYFTPHCKLKVQQVFSIVEQIKKMGM